jgi:type IV secretory pathway VirB10-like protein
MAAMRDRRNNPRVTCDKAHLCFALTLDLDKGAMAQPRAECELQGYANPFLCPTFELSQTGIMSLPSTPSSTVAEAISAPKPKGELAPVPETVSQAPLALSKQAQKRLIKAQKKKEFKTERRARDKALKKAKKAERREKRARGELDGDEEEHARQVKRQKVSQDGAKEKFGAGLVIDLGFDDKMTDRVSDSFPNPSSTS